MNIRFAVIKKACTPQAHHMTTPPITSPSSNRTKRHVNKGTSTETANGKRHFAPRDTTPVFLGVSSTTLTKGETIIWWKETKTCRRSYWHLWGENKI